MSANRLSYSDMFPGRFIHADELDGKAWTLTIERVYQETLKKKDKKKTTIVAFKETPKEYGLNPTNGAVLVALWGQYADLWESHRITIAPANDPSGRGRSGLKIIFIGSPEMTEPRDVKLPGGLQEGETRTLRPTATAKPPATVDHVTGEVDDDIGFGADAPHPSEDALGAAGSDSTSSEGEDGLVPGRGPKSAQGELAG